MKLDKKKIGIIGIIVLLLVAVVLVVIFAAKISTKTKKDKKESNYVLKFESSQNDVKISELDFTYEQKQLKDITLILYYDNAEIAKELASLYKEEESFTNVKQNKNTVELHYASEEFNKYSSYNKEELIEYVTSTGYTYKEGK